MSGILDNKSRVLDAIVTFEGRRQIAAGNLRIEHVSFTDAGAYYAPDLVSGSADASSRITLEACNLPQDQITFEADDSGRLKSFKNGSGIQVQDGQLITYSFDSLESVNITGSLEHATFLKGDEFASTAETLLGSSLENFKRLQLIATHDRIFDDEGFGLGNSNIEFTINNKRPISNPSRFVANLNHLESLFNDVRLSHVKNFKYLPPINKIDDPQIDKSDHRSVSEHSLGQYRPWGRVNNEKLSYAQIKHELEFYERQGYCKTINIDPTSRENNLVCQFFERSYNQLKKLDVIDYGKLRTNDSAHPIGHVFFVGKIFVDDNDTHTFVHLFTLVFD